MVRLIIMLNTLPGKLNRLNTTLMPDRIMVITRAQFLPFHNPHAKMKPRPASMINPIPITRKRVAVIAKTGNPIKDEAHGICSSAISSSSFGICVHPPAVKKLLPARKANPPKRARGS
jgi:hypothetical protein